MSPFTTGLMLFQAVAFLNEYEIVIYKSNDFLSLAIYIVLWHVKIIKVDGFVKSPTSALRCIPRHCDVLYVRLIPRNLRALNLELFTLPSKSDFLRDRQGYV